jgi:hypothetical protein
MKVVSAYPADVNSSIPTRRSRAQSRSAALHRAVRLLRTAELGGIYEAAWDEWAAEGEADLWDSTAGDGLRS